MGNILNLGQTSSRNKGSYKKGTLGKEGIELMKGILSLKMEALDALHEEIEGAIIDCGLDPAKFQIAPESMELFMNETMLDFLEGSDDQDEFTDEAEYQVLHLAYFAQTGSTDYFVMADAFIEEDGYTVGVHMSKCKGNIWYVHNGEGWEEDPETTELMSTLE